MSIDWIRSRVRDYLSFWPRLRPALESRFTPLVFLALVLLLHAGLLEEGLYLDDYILAAAQRGESRFTGRSDSLWELFRFASGDPDQVGPLIERGTYPWWSDPGFRVNFCRPVAAATHRLDVTALGTDPAWMHAHSLTWYLLALLAAGFVYAQLFEARWMVVLTVWAFAMAPQNVVLVGWPSARNGLLALTFGGLALGCHLRWRRSGAVGWLGAFAAAMVVGLFSNEGTSAVLAFVLAHALCLEKGSVRRRLAGVLPCLLLLGLWWLWYQSAGHGVGDSGLYLEPDLLAPGFWAELLRRYVNYLSVALGVGLSVDLWYFSAPETRVLLEGVAWGGLLLLGALTAPLLRRDAELRFWGLALAITALTCCLGPPSDRVLGFCLLAGPGFLLRLARGITAAWDPDAPVNWWRGPLLALVIVVSARATLVHPLLREFYWTNFVHLIDLRAPAAVGGALAPRDLTGRCLVFVNPPHDSFVEQIPSMRFLQGRGLPDRMRMLFPSFYGLRLTRIDERTLEVVTEGHLLSHQHFTRGLGDPFRAGEEVALGDVTYRILEVAPDGSPLRLRLLFRQDPEAPEYLWLRWTGRSFEEFALPAPGETLDVPPTSSRMEFAEPDRGLAALLGRLLDG